MNRKLCLFYVLVPLFANPTAASELIVRHELQTIWKLAQRIEQSSASFQDQWNSISPHGRELLRKEAALEVVAITDDGNWTYRIMNTNTTGFRPVQDVPPAPGDSEAVGALRTSRDFELLHPVYVAISDSDSGRRLLLLREQIDRRNKLALSTATADSIELFDQTLAEQLASQFGPSERSTLLSEASDSLKGRVAAVARVRDSSALDKISQFLLGVGSTDSFASLPASEFPVEQSFDWTATGRQFPGLTRVRVEPRTEIKFFPVQGGTVYILTRQSNILLIEHSEPTDG